MIVRPNAVNSQLRDVAQWLEPWSYKPEALARYTVVRSHPSRPLLNRGYPRFLFI